MDGHKRDAGRVVLDILVLVGEQTDLSEEVLYRCERDAFVDALLYELVDTGKEFVEVLLAVDALWRAVKCCSRHDTGLTHDCFCELVGILGLHDFDEVVHHRCEVGETFACRSGKARLEGILHDLKHGEVMRCRILRDLAEGGIPYPTRRVVDDADKGLVVLRIGGETEVTDGVLDLLALVEGCATVDAVWDIEMPQLVLKHA